jgi:hypothetical protein
VKYLCLVYLDAERWSACSDAECADYVKELAEGKALIAGPLHPVHTATTVRVRGGEGDVSWPPRDARDAPGLLPPSTARPESRASRSAAHRRRGSEGIEGRVVSAKLQGRGA